MSWCGQPWTSDELVAGGALEVVYARWPYAQTFLIARAHHSAYNDADPPVLVAKLPEHDHLVVGNPRAGLTRVDDDGHAHVPELPGRWPRCPMCDGPLHRLTSDQWLCADPQMSRLDLLAP